jgi:signal transduction histidine kinase
MKQSPESIEQATAKEIDELALLRQRIAESRTVLHALQREVEESQTQLRDSRAKQLLQANKELVIPPVTAQPDEWPDEIAEYVARHARLLEANEQLVFAALGAQTLLTAAEQARQRHTETLAVVAHELRSPLAPIRAAAALLGRPNVDQAVLTKVRGILDRQVSHMSRLIGDLMDASRVSTGKLRLDLKRVAMADVFDASLDTCKPTAESRGQSLAVHIEAGAAEAKVEGDPVRLTQMLVNLLDNASKYTPSGGELGLTVTVTGLSMQITVTDSGIGIAPDALAKVFEPFVQDAHAVRFNGGGLGIGLTVVREIAEVHGGLVIARSAGRDQGSQFIVTLPLAAMA